VNDSQCFLLEHFDTIHNSPSQIYCYAIPLSPSSSWLHKYYTAELLQEVKVVRGPPAGWGMCSRIVALNEKAQSLAHFQDTIAVGLWSNDIMILNAITGSQVAVLSGHTNVVKTLAFSSDGMLLVSGSNDKTLKLWDIQTGIIAKTLCGHTHWVLSISISADCTTIASGSHDKTIRLWDIQTGACHHVIRQHKRVTYVSFLPTDPQYFVSLSNGVIQQWDINGHQIGHTHECSYGAFSLNGPYFISCANGVVTVQDSDSRAVVARCKIPNPNAHPTFTHSCLSPNSRLVAAASQNTISIWDITNSDPLHIKTFIGHTEIISSLTFSSSSTLISASHDKSVRFWQISGQPTNLVAGNSKSTPSTSVPIRSISLQANSGIAITCDFKGVVRVWDISTGCCKGSYHKLTGNLDWGDAQMIGGRLIVVLIRDGKIFVGDAERGNLLKIVDLHLGVTGGFKISGDGSKVFCLVGNLLKAWSIQTAEVIGVVEVGVDHNVHLDPLHVDGSKIWVHFKDKPPQGWDFGISGFSPVLLPNTSPERPPLHFIHGISRWGNGLSRIEDTVTGKVVFWFSGRYAMPTEAKWDGRHLVTGYQSGEVLILDFNHLS
jgi:WD40 repeat protein